MAPHRKDLVIRTRLVDGASAWLKGLVISTELVLVTTPVPVRVSGDWIYIFFNVCKHTVSLPREKEIPDLGIWI